MGYLKRLADKKYRIMYNVPPTNGRTRQQKTETFIGVSKKQAEALLAQREAAVANGTYVMDDDMTVSKLFEKFMARKRTCLEAKTFLRYTELFENYLKPAFGNVKLKELRQGHLVERYSAWAEYGRDGRHIGGRTIRHAHDLLRNSLNFAMRMEYIQRNVASLVSSDDLPKAITPKPKALTADELRTLLTAAEHPSSRARKRGMMSSEAWFYPAVMFAAYTGARRGEVLAVRWSDVHFDEDGEESAVTIARSVTETMTYKPPKNDRSRVLTLPDTLVRELKRHREVQATERRAMGEAYRDGDLVFARADGSQVDPGRFGQAFSYVVARSGVSRITLHNLRDTHATLLMRDGVELKVISERLGHADTLITTTRYIHAQRDRDVAAARTFDRRVGNGS